MEREEREEEWEGKGRDKREYDRKGKEGEGDEWERREGKGKEVRLMDERVKREAE